MAEEKETVRLGRATVLREAASDEQATPNQGDQDRAAELARRVNQSMLAFYEAKEER
jgi:hypothetical protein